MTATTVLFAWLAITFAVLWIAALARANRIERDYRSAMEYAAGILVPRHFLTLWLAGDNEALRRTYPTFFASSDDEAGA